MGDIVVVLNMFRLQKYGNDDRKVAEVAKEMYFSQNP
ncbi:hypothetical protein D3OALGB2SA_2161 [Olavius algarvensis associated proteobacterium Delta 3]|nr:hypothetical protein D3OALGB2SA_2161 [Olavius algarvensis associated proteobacterium Delta 3]